MGLPLYSNQTVGAHALACEMCVVRCVSCWMGLLVLLAIGQTATAEVVCKLHMEGFGSEHGIKNAQVSCTGGSIKAVAHPLLAPLVGAKAGVQSSGVLWLEGCEPVVSKDRCMLTICDGSKATFLLASVTRVNLTDLKHLLMRHILCVGENSNVTFDGAAFDRNTGRPITGWGILHIRASNFTNNTLPAGDFLGGALCVEGQGTTVVESSRFIENAGQYRGGAIGVVGGARLTILSSVFEDNRGKRGD